MKHVLKYWFFAMSIAPFSLYSSLATLMNDQIVQREFSPFIDHILRQVPAENFWELVADLKKEYPEAETWTDDQWYSKLRENGAKIRPLFPLVSQLGALKHQKKVLGAQAKELLASVSLTFDGVLEIGTPGTYLSVLVDKFAITGSRYCLNYQESLADYAQALSLSWKRGFRFYDTFVSLNNYEPIASIIPDNTLDLVVCFIGLHHIPQEKLDAFVASLARILRPGGVFLLRDHDAHSEQLKVITSAAHTIFNLFIPNLCVQEENQEYRNFQPLSYWIELLGCHGLHITPGRMLQEGDPTLNTMVAFVKKPKNFLQEEDLLLRRADSMLGYKRSLMQTQLSVPEWHNVDISQSYGEFINHTPFYQFPYGEAIRSYWEVWYKSFNVAAQKQGKLAVLCSPYTLMNLFIGVTSTIEFAAKALLSLPIRLAYAGQEAENLLVVLRDEQGGLELFAPEVTILERTSQGLILASFPRYKGFLAALNKLAQTKCELVCVAGNSEINVKVSWQPDFEMDDAEFKALEAIKNYEWTVPGRQRVYASYTVPVVNLLRVISLFLHRGVTVDYVHDF